MIKLSSIPDTLTIVFFLMAFFIVLTWVIPSGEFERVEDAGRMVVMPGTYQQVDQQPQGIFAFFTAPKRGFEGAAEIIAFVFLIGGAFGIVTRTGAINAGLQSVINFSKKNPGFKAFVIPLVMVLFSIGGATFGMSEEVLAFIIITIPLALALGYDSLVGVAIPFVGAGAGFAGAFSNPFTIGIAQGIAEVSIFSGWEYRIVVWFAFTAISIAYVMIYASKIEKNKTKSTVYEIDIKRELSSEKESASGAMTASNYLVLLILLTTLLFLVVGVNLWDWYITEISGLFIAMGIFSALVSRLPFKETSSAFTEGAKDMVLAAIVIGLTRGLLIIATDGKIIDTILYALSEATSHFPAGVSVQFMFLFQSLLNFFIPSGSGQAALTMPIMAPLSDLLGISRQTAVLAYQFGDGLSNLIIPTSGITMGILAIAEIPYYTWLKWIGWLMVILFLTAMLLLLPPIFLFNWA